MLENPTIAFSPDNPLNMSGTLKQVFLLAAAAFAALFGILSVMRDTLKTEDDVEEKLDARSFGAIAYEPKYKLCGKCCGAKSGGFLSRIL